MPKPLRVLLVEDSENDALLLLRALRHGGFKPQLQRVQTLDEMSARLHSQVWDVVISDYSLPHFSGLAALSTLKDSGLDVPFILVSGTIGEEVAVEAMKAGAHDYVMKGNLQRLGTAIERELRDAELRRDSNRAEEKLRYLANYDPLTDLPNRNLHYERLEQALQAAHREQSPLALILLDLNDFREINDTMGHQLGDLLLKQVGPRIKGALRECDTVARLGGDEFAVLLAGANEEDATLAARKILQVLDAPFVIGDLTLDAQASLGLAIFPQHGVDKDTLMRRADIAMYLAKHSASGYAIYSADHDSYSPERLTLMAELRRAIDNTQLSLAYQPKIDLRTGHVIGLEALARWRHHERGMIPPDRFIAIAERTGLIKSLTFWALNAALGQSRAWREQGLAIPISVNLSARNLHDLNLPDQIAEILRNHGAEPEQLEIEITESVIMADPARAFDILTRINRMGVALFIDDFGTGYSSLGYLKKLPANAIKIDKSFVINMIADENDAMIVRSIIDLAHNLKLKVIAEGVENQDVWNRLAALGCDAAQGYHMSRPLPAPEMTDWLLESPWGLRPVARKVVSVQTLPLEER
jgi:diguanylate cyclase (GGDEF)-like protein